MAVCVAGPVLAAPPPVRPSMADSFRLGVGGGTLCQVQAALADPAAPGLFDRAYAIVCRDAAAPIGHLYALREGSPDPAARLDSRRDPALKCEDKGQITLADAGSVSVRRCSAPDGLGYDFLRTVRGRTLYAAEGLAGYRSALELGLRTLAADRVVPGDIDISITELGDPTSFARAQAGSLDPALARDEGYRRNNGGNYAEAAEFFDTLLRRTAEAGANDPASAKEVGEYLVNRALQQSDLGDIDQADALFAQVALIPTADPVELRLRRNYRALHLLNQQRFDEAVAVLDAPIEAASPTAPAASEIDVDLAVAMNDGGPLTRQLGVTSMALLTPAEKMAILDAQAVAVRGTILRLEGNPDKAAAAFVQALAALDQVRGGRVTSVARLRAQVMTDQSMLAEAKGDMIQAETLLRKAGQTVAIEYPDSVVLNAAQARLAGFYARHGRTDDALKLYRAVVASLGASGGTTGAMSNLLEPYFTLLVAKAPAQPALYDDLFLASQVLLRPGVADTQATLARELSAGTGEAGRIFRQSLNEARQASALRVELARLAALDNPSTEDRATIAADRLQISQIESEQSATQAKLARYPAYRAIATQALTLADLRATLHPGEAYWKLTVAGDSVFALLVTPADAQAWALPYGPAELGKRVDAIRSTVSFVENGRPVTYPFDAAAARQLYVDLAGPAAASLLQARHLIFEPDGAMQRLPISLLIASQPGLDRYEARIKDARADPFDMTGIDWLGGRVDISTALSARAFRDVRATPASTAAKTYLGFGHNAPISPFLRLTAYQPPATAIDCRWPMTTWNHPISPAELRTAQRLIGAGRADVVTDAPFSDTAIDADADLSAYRIVHFATHGLVTAPRPECPATPALLTSFGPGKSDGLLSFDEIYGLHLDADLVLLSACDTAGTADVAATRAAGITSGGGNALDGLVRAFIGAGGRAVLASHWPAPDDYQATQRLIASLFTAPPGTSIAEALRVGQRRLMMTPATSHPFYWAGFALIGDGAKPVLRAN
ncbi:CHAT domain-containing protein [Sphingomonas sp. CGMCC 1.13654]|uniref:CHAT domain-containing protein n=2 Tax=Sphingomonas chungangi TaxID=2683589 RepID=A0A838L3Y1_9SPHN|nr:CHAT domain-containing protein [Sphingomonas chungangi]MVW57932.1 CHAT domain-containing protein [Sphingomonas chungangi]